MTSNDLKCEYMLEIFGGKTLSGFYKLTASRKMTKVREVGITCANLLHRWFVQDCQFAAKVAYLWSSEKCNLN